MGMTEDDKRNCCLLEIQETEAKYYKTLEEIEKVSEGLLGKVSQRGPLFLWREDSSMLPGFSCLSVKSCT